MNKIVKTLVKEFKKIAVLILTYDVPIKIIS